MKDTPTPPSACPSCGKILDMAADLANKYTPSAGDYTVCMYCFGIMRFGDRMQLLPVTYEDQQNLPQECLDDLMHAKSLILAAKLNRDFPS